MLSKLTITYSNIKGYLKPKGMTTNRWCWNCP